MNIGEIVKKYLADNGFDGLFNMGYRLYEREKVKR